MPSNIKFDFLLAMFIRFLLYTLHVDVMRNRLDKLKYKFTENVRVNAVLINLAI